jgi:hypothetical protein
LSAYFGKTARIQSRAEIEILSSIQLDYTECKEHEKENVKIYYPLVNGASACPLCEARIRVRRLEAQYERAMIAAHDLAGLVLGKQKS